MKKINLLILGAAAVASAIAIAACAKADAQPTMKEAFADKFLIGAAVNQWQVAGERPEQLDLVKTHFNSIVAENVMKSEKIHPQENVWNWVPADSFVDFGEANNMFIIGHCLIWHSQLAPWFCVDSLGNEIGPDLLKERMKDHIYTLVGRYKGRIQGWDVVNEAIIEDGSYRDTPFYRILGEEFIPLAFQYAHEADPDAELYYNDYGMNVPGRREAVIKLINNLKERGLRIDAVGMQSHIGLDYPNLNDWEESLKAFAATGCKVMVTELDMTAIPTVNMGANVADTEEYNEALNPYRDALPDDAALAWNNRMTDFFNILLRNSDHITRVTAWGVEDGSSWRNDWPVQGRTDYPLFFDRDLKMKPFMADIIANGRIS